MTKENVRMLYKHYKNMEENGNPSYPNKFQTHIKGRGKLHRMEIEAMRPWLVEEVEEAGGDVSYSDMSKAALTAVAEEKGLDISEAKTKDDLVVILENDSERA